MYCFRHRPSAFRRSGALQTAAFAVAAVSLYGCASAIAADLPSRKAPIAPIFQSASAYSWTGFYVGAQAGYDWGRDKTREYFTANNQFTGMQWSYPTRGFVGGGHVGYNHQLSSLVVGVEGDFEGTGVKGGFVDPGGSGDMKIDWQGSVRGRLGVAFDRLMIYGTGGVAFAKIGYVYGNPVGPIFENTSSVHTGWTAGAGVAYALTDNISARVEYRHANYGSFRYASQVAFPGILTGEQTPRSNTLRGGVSYKF